MSSSDRNKYPKPEEGKFSEPYDTDVGPEHKATIGDYLKSLSNSNIYKGSSQSDYSAETGYPAASSHDVNSTIASVDRTNDTFTGNLINKDQSAVEHLDNLSTSEPTNLIDKGGFVESLEKKDVLNSVAQERQKNNFQSNLLSMNTRFSNLTPGQIDNYEGVPLNENGHPLDIAASLMLAAAGDRKIVNPNPNIERIEKFEKQAIKNNAKIPTNYLLLGGLSKQDAEAESFVPAGTGRVKFENLKPKNAASRKFDDFKFVELTANSFGNMNSYLEPFNDDVGQQLVGPMLRQSIVTLVGCLIQSLKIALICEGLLAAKALALKLDGDIDQKEILVGEKRQFGKSKFQGGVSEFTPGGKISFAKVGEFVKKLIANFPTFVLRYLNINPPFYIMRDAYSDGILLNDFIIFTKSVIKGFMTMLVATITDIGGSAGFFNTLYRSVLRSETSKLDEGNSNKLISYFRNLRDSKILGFVRVLSNLGDISYSAGHDLSSGINSKFNRGIDLRVSMMSNFSNARHTGKRFGGKNVLSDTYMPNLLIQNVLSEYNIGSMKLVDYRGNEIANTQTPAFNDFNFGDFSDKPYHEVETLRHMENLLETESVPFYFHDTRTNEIVSFHAFINSLSDSYAANFSSQKGFGRIEGTQVYSDTTRSISVDFTIVPYNKEDMSTMYMKINKLTTLVYPQWSKGTRVVAETGADEATVFTQPFSQVPTATPLVRMRIGDLIKNNYSRKILAKLHGSEDAGMITVEDGEITKTAIYEDVYESTTATWKSATMLTADIIGTKHSNAGVSGMEDLVAAIAGETGASTSAISALSADNILGAENPDVNLTFNIDSSIVFNDKRARMAVQINPGQVGMDFVKPTFYTQLGIKAAGFGTIKPLIPPKYTGNASVKVVSYRLLDYNSSMAFGKPVPDRVLCYDIEINTNLHYFWSQEFESQMVTEAPGGIWGNTQKQYSDRSAEEMMGYVTVKRFTLFTDGTSEFDRILTGKSYVSNSSKVSKKTGQVEVGETVETEKITKYQESIEGFKKIFNDQNPIIRSFESTMTEGLAGVITSLSFDWQINTSPWEMEPGMTAPMMCKVSLSYAPIHDIAPGIDHNGMNRAPIYRVGDHANSLNGRMPAIVNNSISPMKSLKARDFVNKEESEAKEAEKLNDVTELDKQIEAVNNLG